MEQEKVQELKEQIQPIIDEAADKISKLGLKIKTRVHDCGYSTYRDSWYMIGEIFNVTETEYKITVYFDEVYYKDDQTRNTADRT